MIISLIISLGVADISNNLTDLLSRFPPLIILFPIFLFGINAPPFIGLEFGGGVWVTALVSLLYQYPEELMQNMMYIEQLVDLKKEKKVKSWCKKLELRLNKSSLNGFSWKVRAQKNKDSKVIEPEVVLERHGTTSSWALGSGLFRSKVYKDLCNFGESLNSLLTKNSYFELNNSKFEASDFPTSIKDLLETAKKSFTMSRYKGLGEMNADQLWDTTMDPEARLLGQVTIDDAQKADELFNALMGDDVEPRKLFIDENAKFVVNLDI